MATAPIQPNAAALRFFAARDPSRAQIYSDPAALKSAFDAAVAKASSRSPDSDYNANGGSEARLYSEALANIYGITDYAPPGFNNPYKGK
jgi:hypothetical protein